MRSRLAAALLIGRDGVGFTNAHVIWGAHRQPDRFKLVIALDNVFFGADVTCAARLSSDPMAPQPVGVRVERDTALIKVRPPDLNLTTWTVAGIEVARRHEGPLPEFTVLSIGSNPRSGETIRVLGFGSISAIPRRWSTQGMVDEYEQGDDGVQIYSMRFTLPPQPGNSGSPVLNTRGQVVGLLTWYSRFDQTTAWAIAGSELRRPCP